MLQQATILVKTFASKSEQYIFPYSLGHLLITQQFDLLFYTTYKKYI